MHSIDYGATNFVIYTENVYFLIFVLIILVILMYTIFFVNTRFQHYSALELFSPGSQFFQEIFICCLQIFKPSEYEYIYEQGIVILCEQQGHLHILLYFQMLYFILLSPVLILETMFTLIFMISISEIYNVPFLLPLDFGIYHSVICIF